MIPYSETIYYNLAPIIKRILSKLGVFTAEQHIDNTVSWEINGKRYRLIIQEEKD